jgi:predicted nucleic acid-binding protein
VSRKWVLNASPLIALSKISQTSLIERLCEEFVVPEGVALEIGQGPPDDPATNWIEGPGSRNIRKLGEILPTIQAWDLGRGESEVLSWAHQNPGFEAAVDDRAARNCASAFGIPVRGTIGVVLLAKQNGHISEVGSLLDQLVKSGLRIDAKVRRKALDLAGEV